MNCNGTDLKSIGERIRTARENLNMKQEELAEKLFCKREVVSYYENGNRDIKTETLIRISKILGVSADYLLGLSPNNTTDKDLDSVCQYVGLSQEAIANILDWKENVVFTGGKYSYETLSLLRGGNIESFVNVLDSLIVSPDFPILLHNINNYLKSISDLQSVEKKLIDVRKRFESDTDWINETIDEFDENGLFDAKEMTDLYLFRIQEAIKNIVRNIVTEGEKE